MRGSAGAPRGCVDEVSEEAQPGKILADDSASALSRVYANVQQQRPLLERCAAFDGLAQRQRKARQPRQVTRVCQPRAGRGG